MPNVRIEGFGPGNRDRTAKVLRETKTMIIVEWGGGSKRFNKKSLHEVGDSDIWFGYRLAKSTTPIE